MIQNRRKFIKQLGAGTLTAAVVPQLLSCSKKEVRLTVLHTNDVHSQIEPLPADHHEYPNGGGFAKRAALVEKIRQENDNVLLLDCGDIFQGTPYFNFYKGELEIKLMSKMGYDAGTIGNHEFDNGIEELSKQIKKANFPFICSNYVFDNTPLEGLTIPYKTFIKGPLKIGIMGLGIELDGLVNNDRFGNTQYINPIEVANNTAKLLKEKEKCDYIIALSHLGFDYAYDKVSDKKIAENTSDINMILGGHTHTFMKEPAIAINKVGKEVIINQVGKSGIFLGRLDITFSTENKQPTVLNTIYHI
nr:metallophosphatase [uncultured Carboxylicivirga sp.]